MAVSKLTVATEHLNRSIELYFRGDSDSSALHLAGAAQELLAKFVERSGTKPDTTPRPSERKDFPKLSGLAPDFFFVSRELLSVGSI
ncbi:MULTISPECIES: hypothetical protein [unclassified Duganella]|uniref:hypothetical protein n=1 Tax=unclassified Duganella TaxID=2636909 RepID=UPI000E353BB0|nr:MULTISPECIES: hypothetical protein [unclassified Duganella]RFP13620.1 hypothetical protein D0T23_14530 [Duganella sp. BJB475]RFP36328.1 hypothetical protein D0T21_07885 [Duganella sp. BJB476]